MTQLEGILVKQLSDCLVDDQLTTVIVARPQDIRQHNAGEIEFTPSHSQNSFRYKIKSLTEQYSSIKCRSVAQVV